MGRRIANICITITLTAWFILLGLTIFSESYLRLFETLKDLWISCKYYVVTIFGLDAEVLSSVNDYSDVMAFSGYLPEDFEAFKMRFMGFLILLTSGNNFKEYMVAVGEFAQNLTIVISMGLPIVLLVIVLIKFSYGRGNTDHNKDTRPLKLYKKITEKLVLPVNAFIRQYYRYITEQRHIITVWVITWLMHLNIISIAVAFLAYYLYFAAAFDLVNIYVQVVKLVVDLQVILTKVPLFVTLIILAILFDNVRKRRANNKLRHFEARNCGFINELPIVSLTCGSMGKKKTTVITDMALSQEVMFRQKALDILQRADLKFPHFPWIAFEDELRACMEHHTVYSLATAKRWVRLKQFRFERHYNADRQLYGYDVNRYGLEYEDGLKYSYLFDILETYAQAYFIYVIQSSLIVSNYSIRTDNRYITNGNFPLWSTDFFPERITEGRFAHVLDFDALRLGKKVLEHNPNAGSFEFGVVVISEIGKERGNNLELKEIKKATTETNQKNDLFNAWLKMCRHSATVDNFPFIKVFADEQRPESWGADARDLCDVINIASSGNPRLALPFYTIEEMITEWCFNKFIGLYEDFRYRRGDNTLLVYVLKSITAWLWRRNIRIYNKYGYSILKLEKEHGTMDGKVENKKYYLMNQKIYARRFSTDCFSDYFNDLASKTNIGLNDYIEYVTEKATVDELKMQNSYFINGLYKDAD